MRNEIKALNRRLFSLLQRISFKEKRDIEEARALQRAYAKLADDMGMDLLDLINTSSKFELLS